MDMAKALRLSPEGSHSQKIKCCSSPLPHTTISPFSTLYSGTTPLAVWPVAWNPYADLGVCDEVDIMYDVVYMVAICWTHRGGNKCRTNYMDDR